jgi:hypothetical protein
VGHSPITFVLFPRASPEIDARNALGSTEKARVIVAASLLL